VTISLVLDHRHPAGVAEALREVDGLRLIEPPDDESLLVAFSEAEAVATFRWREGFLGPNLRWVQSISAGVEQFPLEALAEAGVVLTSARGVHPPQVAEHAFALLLALTRKVGVSMRDAESEIWKPRMAYELDGATLGVLGLGAIGDEIARRALVWGMDVIGTKRDPAGYDGPARLVYGPGETIEVFRKSDAVVSVLPGTDETFHAVGSGELGALGKGWFVNVGRGSTLDTAALLDALDRGELRGAGLDVFEHEPLEADSPLWRHPKVVITPHIAGFSPRYGPRLAEIVRNNLAALDGRGEWVNRVI